MNSVRAGPPMALFWELEPRSHKLSYCSERREAQEGQACLGAGGRGERAASGVRRRAKAVVTEFQPGPCYGVSVPMNLS